MNLTLPSRVSDCGPDSQPPRDFRDWLFDVVDEATGALSYSIEGRGMAVALKLRLEAIDRAQTALSEAKALLEAGA